MAGQDNYSLPKGYGWADWTGREDAEQQWRDFHYTVRGSFRKRFDGMRKPDGSLNPLSKRIAHWDHGIGKAKVHTDNPGWRGYVFRDGTIWYITHFSRKGDKDHKEQIAVALRARARHKSNKAQ